MTKNGWLLRFRYVHVQAEVHRRVLQYLCVVNFAALRCGAVQCRECAVVETRNEHRKNYFFDFPRKSLAAINSCRQDALARINV